MHWLFKRFILAIIILVLGAAILNGQYFLRNLKQWFWPPQPKVVTTTQVNLSPDTLIIESLGISAPVVYIEEKTETAYQEALERGVVHFPDTAKVGEAGTVYIFGHSSDYPWGKGKFKTVFATLPQIKIGSSIFITNQNSQPFIYKVISTKIISPNDTSVLEQDLSKHLLILQTSYPVGTALKRYIVIAELVLSEGSLP